MPNLLTSDREIFVSYAREDEAQARELIRVLGSHGLQCWIDRNEIEVGGDFRERILNGIRRAQVLIVLVSQYSIASDFVRLEVGAAEGAGRTILQVVVDGTRSTTLRAPFDRSKHVSSFPEGIREGAELDRFIADVVALIRKGRLRRKLVRITTVLCGIVFAVGLWRTFGVVGSLGGILSDESPPRAGTGFGLASSANAQPFTSAPLAYDHAKDTAAPEENRPRIAIDLYGLSRAATNWTALGPETSLRSGEHFYIRAETFTPGFLYVFSVDSSGALQWLFPSNSASAFSFGANPLPSRIAFTLPHGSTNAYALDSKAGDERMFTVFSATRWVALERALENVASGKATAGKDVAALLAVADALTDRAKGIARVETTPVVKDVSQGTGSSGPKPVALEPRSLQANGHWILDVRRFRHLAANTGKQ